MSKLIYDASDLSAPTVEVIDAELTFEDLEKAAEVRAHIRAIRGEERMSEEDSAKATELLCNPARKKANDEAFWQSVWDGLQELRQKGEEDERA